MRFYIKIQVVFYEILAAKAAQYAWGVIDKNNFKGIKMAA